MARSARAGGLGEDEVAALRTAVLRLARWMRQVSADEGLTPAQSGVLGTLVREGPIRAGDLAIEEALNPTMLSRVLGHLERAGLAARACDDRDRRGTLVQATPAGRERVERLRAGHRARLVARLERLSAGEAEALRAALPALAALAGARAPHAEAPARAAGRPGAP